MRTLDHLIRDLEEGIILLDWGATEAARVRYHLEQLSAHHVQGVDRLAAKLRTAIRTKSKPEFRGALAEAHYAMRFARAGIDVRVEPTGRRGPDFLVRGSGVSVYIELKRLVLTEPRVRENVAHWYDNEASPSSAPRGTGAPTLRLLGCIRDAEGQLVDAALNVVIIHDFSLEVTRSNFLEAVSVIEAESANGLHRRLTAVMYHSNYTASQVPAPDWLWVRPTEGARDSLVTLFGSAFSIVTADLGDESDAWWDAPG